MFYKNVSCHVAWKGKSFIFCVTSKFILLGAESCDVVPTLFVSAGGSWIKPAMKLYLDQYI